MLMWSFGPFMSVFPSFNRASFRPSGAEKLVEGCCSSHPGAPNSRKKVLHLYQRPESR